MQNIRRRWFICSLCAWILFSNVNFALAQSDKNNKNIASLLSTSTNSTDNNSSNRYIIGLKKDRKTDAFFNKKKIKQKKHKQFKLTNSISLELAPDEVKELRKDDDVIFIEPDSSVAQSEIDYSQNQVLPWGIKAIGADQAHSQQATGEGINIAILDTGVSQHPDLVVSGGISFVDGVSSFLDDNGHGTHVAGIIRGIENDFGIVGAAPHANIYSVKVLNQNGTGSYSSVIEGIEWAVEHQMNIISMSLGGSVYSQALYNAIVEAKNHGILIIAAAGNYGSGEETEQYPALFTETVSVGAVDPSFQRADFSSTGAELDLVAPGTNILSTSNTGSYVEMSGTSMSVGFVTGTAALIWERNHALTDQEVREKLVSSATPLGDVRLYGKGIINAAKALEITNDPIPPLGTGTSEPTGTLPITSGDVHASAACNPATSQNIMAGRDSTKVACTFSSSNSLIVKVFNISTGIEVLKADLGTGSGERSYTWSPTASLGRGKYRIYYFVGSTAQQTWDITVTNYVTAPSVNSTPTSNSITLNWMPVNNAKYYIVDRLNGSLLWPNYGNSETITGLTPNTLYQFKITSYNSDDVSSVPTYVNVRTLNQVDTVKPTVPTNLQVSSQSSSIVSLSWNASTDANGISGYRIYRNDTLIWTTVALNYTDTGLLPGVSYRYKVSALDNANNASDFSAEKVITTDHSNTFTDATPMSLGIGVTGEIGYADDTDIFSLTPSISGKYRFRTNGSTDTFGILYNSSFSSIEYNDDDETSANFAFSCDLIAGQTYYIEVSTYTSLTTGAYQLIVDRPYDDVVNDNTSMVALPANATINYPGDEDVFRFSPNSDGYYAIRSTGETDVYGYLSDSQQNLLNADDDSGGNYNFKIVHYLFGNQTYYVKVRHYNINMTGNYNVLFEVSAPPDATPPSAPVIAVSNSDWTNSDVTITITSGADTGVARSQYKIGTSGSWIDYISPVILNAEGASNVYARTINLAGNVSSEATSIVKIDKTMPTIPNNVEVMDRTDTSVRLNWTASTDNVGVVGYDVYRGTTLVDSTTATSYTVTGLTAGTAYKFSIKAKDAAGNVSAFSAVIDVTTAASLDTQAPSAPTNLTATDITSASLTLNWTASSDNVGVTGYDVFRGRLLLGTTTATNYTVTGLSPAITKIFTIQARDAAGNVSEISDRVYIEDDMEAPTVPAGLAVASKTSTSASLSWVASTDKVGVTGYDVYRGGTLVGSSTTTNYTVTGLTASTAYSFSVKARDAAGNVSGASAAVSVTTSPVDTQAPAAITDVRNQMAKYNYISLIWSASTDNVGVTGYNIYQDSTLIGSTTSTSYTATGLTPSTTYRFTVRAKDAEGNLSTASNVLTVTTGSAPDTEAPTVPTGLNVVGVSRNVITVVWNPSADNVGVAGYILTIVGGGTTRKLTLEGPNTDYTASGAPNTQYTFTVKAYDAVGNASAASNSVTATTKP